MPNFVPVVYSGGAPVLASNGTQRVAIPELAEWLQVYDALQVFRGRGHVVFYQTMGGADASAGTHKCGSAWDQKWTGDAAIMDAREMGGDLQHRIPGRDGWPSSGADHCHGVLWVPGSNDCNAYQYTAWLAGFNGLGANPGHAAKDRLPLPSQIRTWQQGIEWAQAQIAQQEDDMELICIFYDDGADPKDGQYASTAIVHSTTGWVRTSTGYGSRAELDAWKAIAGVLGMTITEKHVNANGWVMAQRFAPAKSAPSVTANIDYPTLAKAVADELAKRMEN